jgi:hypothetical protein
MKRRTVLPALAVMAFGVLASAAEPAATAKQQEPVPDQGGFGLVSPPLVPYQCS